MKGEDEGISWGFMVLLTFIFLAIFFVIVGRFFRPDVQVAILNTENLATKIDEACSVGQAKLSDFSLPQSKPQTFGGITTFLPKFAIYGGGDPNYVLYYEAFPIGEGVGWEVYQEFKNRFIAPFSKEYSGGDINNFNIALDDHLDTISAKIKDAGEGTIIIPNIVLSDYTNVFPAEDPKPLIKTQDNQNSKRGNLGKWSTEKRFDFTQFAALSPLEKSSIKYRPCGADALCLKTRESVYKFPLENCKGKINNIHLEYDARGLDTERFLKIASGGAILIGEIAYLRGNPISLIKHPFLYIIGSGIALNKIINGFMESVLTQKASDFYIASPCSIESDIEIQKVLCITLKCARWLKYPMYEITGSGNNLNVEKIKDHYQCAEPIGTDIDTLHDEDPPGDCIRIKIKKIPSNYCWTPNPIVHEFDDVWGTLFLPTTQDIIQGALNDLGGTPVTKLTSYMKDGHIIILKSSETANAYLGNFLQSVAGLWAWSWPGHD